MELQATPSDPAARIQLIPNPIVSPGCCGICGTNEHPVGFADARLDFEWYGTFYLCGTCVGDYAQLFGFISVDQYEAIKRQNLKQLAEIEWYRSQLEDARSLLNVKYSVGDSLLGDHIAESVIDSSDDETDVEGESGQVIELPHIHISGKQSSDESVSDEGSDGVSGDSSDDSNGDGNESDPIGLS